MQSANSTFLLIMTTTPVFSAVILAGGRATRMQGADKGLVLWQGQPLITQVLTKLQPQVDDVVISCNRHFAEYSQYGTVVADTVANFAGPLAGMAAALPCCRHDWVLVVACDMPCLPLNLTQQLWQALDNTRLAVAHDGEHLQPLCLLLHRSLLVSIEDEVTNGHAAVYKWIHKHAHNIAYINDKTAFININSLAEL